MRKILFLAVILTASFLVSGLASATHITEMTGNADCEGWSASMTVLWRWEIYEGELDYSVVLSDEDGNEVTREDWAGPLTRDPENSLVNYTYDGMWDMELCGDYTVVGTFHIIAPIGNGSFENSTMEFTAAFTCECDEPGDCFLTPGYWKNHARNWPQDTLVLGGVTLSRDDLIAILKSSVRGGDATVILAHHLIAAKLNVLNGADDSIVPVIDEADAYLVMHPVFSNPSDEEGRQYALDLKDMLGDYNEQGCPEEDDGDDDDDDDDDSADKFMSSSVERTSWGTLKTLYR